MSTKNTIITITLLILTSTLIGVVLWPRLPERMASHWNVYNEVDGYTSRFWGIMLFPMVTTILGIFLLIVPLIDPLKNNFATFRNLYNKFIVFFTAFMIYLYLLTLVYNLGHRFSMSMALFPALGVFIYYAGVLMRKAQRNWFIGIRTPWTLSSDRVWSKTHRLGAILFKSCAFLIVLGAFFGPYAIWFILVPLFGSTIFLVIYSYVLFRQEGGESLPFNTETKTDIQEHTESYQ